LPNRETAIGQKTWSLEEASFCLSSSPDKHKNTLRPLRLHGEISESVSAIIGENLRLNLFAPWPFGTINFLEVVLINISKLKN
jgi:hypothetical protein